MLIIFDLDGTLFQTELCTVQSIYVLAQEIGLKAPEQFCIIKNIGKKTEQFLSSVFPNQTITQEICNRFRSIERQQVAEHGVAFDGTREMLAKLKEQGHILSICSNGSEGYIKLVLETTQITSYFDQICSARQFASKAEAVTSLCSGNTNAILVGDTQEDRKAAICNRIPFIKAQYGYGEKDDIESTTFSVNTPLEILPCVAQAEVFYHVAERLIEPGKRVIGINGVDTSGKTIFTNQFAKYLTHKGIQTAVLHIDDYHNPAEIRRQGDSEIDAYYHNAFHYRQVVEEVLKPLHQAGELHKEVLCLNLDTNLYENKVRYDIGQDTVLLIEGVLLFREPLLPYLDGTVFLNITFEEVIQRATVRDVPKYGVGFLQKYHDKYIPIQKKYFTQYNPYENSHIVIDNNDYHNPKIEREMI